MSQFIRFCKLLPIACLFMLWMGPGAITITFAQTTEICNNGIDDDGDRLIDCQDPDCPECARFINCVEPNTCYMPPIWADPKSPTALSDAGDSVYGAQDLVLSTNAEFTTVNIRTPDGSYNRTVVVTATGSTIVQLPLAVVMSNSPNTIQRNKGLIITSDEPVQVTYRQTPGLNQDIVPLKCRAALGYSFYAGSQTRLTTTNVANERHFVSVMATQPNTVVTFRSPIAFDGVNTFPLSVTLQDNETYMLASRLINSGGNSANESVAGVLITSNQPIVVNSGSQHTSQPYSGNRDAGMDQLVPIRTTGTSYVAMHSQNTTNNSDYVFVIASENNTTVSISGPSTTTGAAGVLSTTTLSAGQVFTYNLPNVPNRAYSITTSKRAYVFHVSSYAANEFGMGILPTINPCNGSKRIDFYRTTGSSNDQAVVTIPTAGLASLTFRGAAYTTYGTVVDNITIAGVAHSIVSFPNTSIAAAGTVNTLTSTERFHVGVVSNTGGASTGNFGFYSNYEAKVDVLNPITKQPDDFYTVAQVVTGVATPHCLTLTSCGTDDRITGIVNGTYTQGTSFTGACLTYTMQTSAPKCARDTIRVQVENNIGRQGIICLEFVNIDNNLITNIIPESPVVCQPGGVANLTIVAAQTDNASGIRYIYQTITPDKQIISTSIVSGTATGIYRISVTDSNGCRDTTNVTARPETATIGFGSGPTTVCAGATATYTITSTTGTYGWSVTGGTIIAGGTSTSNSATIRWTSSGTVRATVTSSNGCTAVVTRAVTVLPVPTLSSTQQNPLCNGTSTGSINLAVASGSSPYTYRWSTGATTEDISALVAGVYSVTVTDKFGCTPAAGPLSATLTNVAGLSVTTSRANLLCNGASTGTAGVTATGGTLPYRYTWSNGVTTQTVTGLAAGSYTVTVQDANNCTLAPVVSVTQPTAIVPTITRTNVACNGGSTGSLTLTVSGGTPGYTYRWNDGNRDQNRTGLPAGAYSVTITDVNNCTALASTQLTEPSGLTLAATAIDVRCNGAAQGSIDLTVSGGTPGYTYRWNTGANTEDLSNVSAGVYSVTVTDANACARTLSATVAQPSALTLTLSPQNPTCNGGTNGAITTTLTGGTVPQSYRWSDGNRSAGAGQPGGTTANRTGLAAGTYSVTATDANGCIIVATTALVAPSAVAATGSVTNVACSGGSTGRVSVSPTGGTAPYSYSWNTGATTPTISNLASGEYSVTITDANGCRFDFGATVLQPRPLSVTMLTTDAPCFGGSGNITTEVRGGTEPYSYRWSNGATSPTIFGLPAGTYQLVVTDANGCTATTSATVNQPPAFAINAIVVPVNCNGRADASINVTVEGGTAPYSYSWSTGATSEDLSNLPAGTYSLTVTDARNCIEAVMINVQEPPTISLTSSQTNVACFGGTTGAIDLGVSGGTQPYAYQWADNITTEDRLNLQAGTFRVVVTDKNSCTATRTMSLTQPTALTVVPSVSAVSCNDGSNGAVALNVSGGVGPYSYNWVTGATSSSLNGLMTGFYSATVTDANSCTVSLLNQVTQPSALTVRTTQQDATCNGGNNGAINITVSGGTPGYRYRWVDGDGQPGPTTPDRTGLSAGTYSLTILDANNCGQFRAFTIGQPAALSLTSTVQPVACAGGNTGAISLNLSGGVGPYDVRWNDNNTATNRTGLVAGTYSVTATDANLCTITRTFSVTQPTPLGATGMTRNVSCAGGSDGTISLTVSGGTADYTYTWLGGVANPSAQNQTGLAAGPYTVSVQDANGCQTSRSFSLTQPEPLRVTARVTPASCFQGTDGAIAIEVSGGTRPYQYRWQSGQSTSAVSGLAAGTYSITVTDAQGCAEVVSATVTEPTLITMMVRPTLARCNGSSDGAADLSVSGGIAPYRFAWTTLAGAPVATTEDLSNIRAGAYVVTVTDLNNCPASMTVSIGQPSALSLTLLGTNNLCPSDLTGAINLTVTGGTAFTTGTPYTYLWNNSFPDRNIGDLMPGSYSVVVTDANGCTATGSTSLTAPPALVATFSTTNVSCASGSNGTIDLTVTGGVAPYSYTWVDGYDVIGPITQDRANLSANTYTVTVRDRNGCRTDVVITINEPTALSLSGSTTAVTCNGGSTGSLSATALGGTPGYTYRWNTGGATPTLTAQPAGIYALTATDANQCSTSLSLTVEQPSTLSLTSQVVNVSCDGSSNGTASVTVSGGVSPYRYQWSTGATTQNVSNLPGGNYTVTVTDANGCTIAASVAITQPLPLTASVLGTDALCFGGATGTITTEVRGGTPAYLYRWSTGSTDPTVQSLVASSTPYSLTVTDANGCTALTGTTIGQPQPYNLNAVVVPVACQGGANGSIDLTISGSTAPYRFVWSTGATTEDVSGLVSGIYSVTVLDRNDCPESVTINVSQPGSLSVGVSSLSLTCFGNQTGQISVTAVGGSSPYRYVWSDNGVASPASTSARSGLVTGSYSVTVLDNNGCAEVRSVNLSQPTALSLVESVTAVACNGGNTGVLSVSGLGGTLPYAYRWSTSATTSRIASLTTGSYSVTVTDGNGCFISQTYSVTQPTALSLSGSATAVACNGDQSGAARVVASGGSGPYNYTWNTGATADQISSLSAGVYSVTVTDGNGCFNVQSLTVNQPTALSLSTSPVNILCNGASTGSISISLTGGMPIYSYLWNDRDGGPGNTTANRSNLVAGVYSLTATDSNGCTISRSLTLTQPTTLSTFTEVTNVSCEGGSNGTASLTVSGGVQPYSYSWTNRDGGPGASTSVITGLARGNYGVTVTDANGCTIAASVAITQPLPLTASVLGTDALCFGGANGTITTEVRGGTPAYSYRWSTGSTDPTAQSLAASSSPYSLTVTDANGCTALTGTTIGQPQPYNFNAVVVPVACQGGANGSIDLTVSGSTAPYRFVWSTGATSEDVSGLVSGIYSVTVLDRNDCPESVTINVGQPGSLSVSVSSLSLTCFGNQTGQISVTAVGGSSPYRYVWSDNGVASPASTSVRSGLVTGSYSVTVLDNNGCFDVRTVAVNQPTALTLSCTTIDVTRNGEATGTASISATGGTPNYSYQWNTRDGGPGGTSATITSLTAGLYSVTVTDANGCSDVKSLSIGQPTGLSVTPSSESVVCNNGNTGRASVSASGGVGPYTYAWSDNGVSSPASTSERTGLPAGTYSVTVTDANGATQVTTMVVTQPPALTLTPTVRPVSCHGGSDGVVSLSVSGGTPANINAGGSGTATSGTTTAGNGGYTYQWSTGESATGSTTASISSLTAGTYSVTVTDANGCTALQSVSVVQPTALSLASGSTSVAINGQATGRISLTVTGGTPTTSGQAYTYSWNDSNGESTPNRSGLPAGTYSVTVTDANGCPISTTILISEPPALTLTASATAVSCNGGSNGTSSLTIAGGVGPYTYQWKNTAGQTVGTTQSLTGLAKGNYEVLVTDANGATATASVAVTQPKPLTASVLGTDALCNGQASGTITTEVRGGTPTYSYLWNTGSTNATVQSLTASSTPYSLTVTDANGCTALTSTTIGQPQPFNLNAVVVPVSCQGGDTGSIDLTVEGSTAPYRYRWSTGATTQDVASLTAGIYSVTVIDANDCVESTTVNVSQPGALSVNLIQKDLTCFQNESGQVSLTATGGIGPYTYMWSDNGTPSSASTPDRTGLDAGPYSITVLDANGCSVMQSITINEPTALSLTGSTTAVSRNGAANGALSVSALGGTPGTPTSYSYAWNTGSTTADINSLTAGIYSVTVTDANGCFEVQSFTVSQPTRLTLTTTPDNVACYEASTGSIVANASGGVGPYTYVWSDNGVSSPVSTSVRTGLPAGTYSVTVIDANRATEATTVVVSQPPALTVTPIVQNVSCYGSNNGLISLNVSGGTPATTSAGGSGTAGSGTSGTSNASYTYVWDTGAPNSTTTSFIGGLTAGVYSVTVTDANGCTSLQNVSVAQPSALSLASGSTSVAINGQATGRISLTVTGGTSYTVGEPYSYSWTDENTGQSGGETADRYNLPAGVYSVTVVDANGCTISTTITISEPPALTLTTQVQPVSCDGGQNGAASLTVAGGVGPYTYQWTTPNGLTVANTQNLTGLSSGNYQVLVTDANGATAIAGVAIAQPDPLMASMLSTSVLCNGQLTGQITTEVRGGTPNYTYLWNTRDGGPGSTNATVQELPASSTPYTLTVTDANGCTATTQATIAQPQPFNLNAVVKPVTCRGGNNGSIDLTVEGATPLYSYLWNTGATTQDISSLTAGTYSVTVIDANNCVESTTIIVQEPPSLSLALTTRNPTCFSGTNGVVSLTATGGTEPYTYVWADNGLPSEASTGQRTDLLAGVYSVTVTDANGCSEVRSVTLQEGSRPRVQLTAVPSTLAGPVSRNDGQLILRGFEPTDRFDFTKGGLYTGPATTPEGLPPVPTDGVLTRSLPNPSLRWSLPSDIKPQPYTVRVFDANGCSTDVTAVMQPSVFTCSPRPIKMPVLIEKTK